MSNENMPQDTNGNYAEPSTSHQQKKFSVATFLVVAGLAIIIAGCLVADVAHLTIKLESQRTYDLRSASVPLFIIGTCLFVIGSIIYVAKRQLITRIRGTNRLSWLLALLALIVLLIVNFIPRHDTIYFQPYDRPHFEVQVAAYGWPYAIREVRSGFSPSARTGDYVIMKPFTEEGYITQRRLKWLLNIVHWTLIIGGVLIISEVVYSRKPETA